MVFIFIFSVPGSSSTSYSNVSLFTILMFVCPGDTPINLLDSSILAIVLSSLTKLL